MRWPQKSFFAQLAFRLSWFMKQASSFFTDKISPIKFQTIVKSNGGQDDPNGVFPDNTFVSSVLDLWNKQAQYPWMKHLWSNLTILWSKWRQDYLQWSLFWLDMHFICHLVHEMSKLIMLGQSISNHISNDFGR